MKLHAEISPNDHKYYGTEIKLTTEDGREAYFNVWINEVSDYKPSARELVDWNEEENGPYEICDNHYETATALHICRTIVAALDGLEI